MGIVPIKRTKPLARPPPKNGGFLFERNMVERTKDTIKQIRENELWRVAIEIGNRRVDEGTALIGENLPGGFVRILLNGQHLYDFPRRLIERTGRVNACVFVEKLLSENHSE